MPGSWAPVLSPGEKAGAADFAGLGFELVECSACASFGGVGGGGCVVDAGEALRDAVQIFGALSAVENQGPLVFGGFEFRGVVGGGLHAVLGVEVDIHPDEALACA